MCERKGRGRKRKDASGKRRKKIFDEGEGHEREECEGMRGGGIVEGKSEKARLRERRGEARGKRKKYRLE